jgi:hypothetical protein
LGQKSTNMTVVETNVSGKLRRCSFAPISECGSQQVVRWTSARFAADRPILRGSDGLWVDIPVAVDLGTDALARLYPDDDSRSVDP